MSMKCISPKIPLLYGKTGVYRGIPIFLSTFDPKHRLWVLVRTASEKNKNNKLENCNFYNFGKINCLLQGCVFRVVFYLTIQSEGEHHKKVQKRPYCW